MFDQDIKFMNFSYILSTSVCIIVCQKLDNDFKI